jgi:hypothetical protein
MKLKSLLIAALALGGLAAGQASAQNSEKDAPLYPNIGSADCTLAASHYNVPVGQSYSYLVRVSFTDFSPLPPPTYRPFTVVFYGTKNGVSDIGPGGETYPSNVPGNYATVLPGYFNTGAFTGSYVRYARIYRNGQLFCVTNAVSMSLQ